MLMQGGNSSLIMMVMILKNTILRQTVTIIQAIVLVKVEVTETVPVIVNDGGKSEGNNHGESSHNREYDDKNVGKNTARENVNWR